MSRLPNDAARRRQLAERRLDQRKPWPAKPGLANHVFSRAELIEFRRLGRANISYFPHQGARETSRRQSFP